MMLSIRNKLVLILREAGFRIEEADNGLAALTQAQIQHLILIEYLMPVMDGLEAIRRIREDESLRHVPIIMLTTSVRMKDVPIALASGRPSRLSPPVLISPGYLVSFAGANGRS